MKIAMAFVCLGASISFCSSAFAAFFDGNRLNNDRAGYLAIERGGSKSTDYQSNAFYTGYITGVADTVSGILFCAPDNVTVGQTAAIVSKYMDENPDKWSLAADLVVINALKTAFPCPSNK